MAWNPVVGSAQNFLGGQVEGGVIRSILTNGQLSEGETKGAFGAGLWWGPGDLLFKPSFLTDGNNHALGLSAGARFFRQIGLSAKVTFLSDQFTNTFLDPNQELQTLDRTQWFVL